MMFTVLMCCNRDDGYLSQAILSVLNQTYKDFEFIIVLNNCNDELERFVRSFSDQRIRVFRNKIGQLSFNLNFGIEAANGEYIVRMDADDVCFPDRLEKNLEIILKNPNVDIIAGSAEIINEIGETVNYNILKPDIRWKSMVRYKNPFIHPAVTIRKEFVILKRGYLGGFQSEDYDLWLRCSTDKKCNVTVVKDMLIKYRLSNDQTRGSLLAYAEVAGYLLRELIVKFNALFFFYFIISVLKPYFKKTKR